MILVTGAAGKTGRAVLRALGRRGAPARALVRRAGQEGAVRAAGASEVVVADLGEATAVARATRDVEAIYHVCPNVHPAEVAIGETVIAAAAGAAGIERLVFHSVLHPQTEAMPHHWRKLRVEERLFESGLPFAILQPAPYMQNVLAHRRRIVGEGVLPAPYPVETRLGAVDLEDVAEVAARALTEPGHLGATYELCGGEALSQRELAARLGEAIGRPVRALEVPLAEWRRSALEAGLDAERVETLAAMFAYYARHGLAGNPNVLAGLLGRAPTSWREFAARELAGGAAAAEPARG